MARYKICKHCGQSIDTEVMDLENHEFYCQRHQRDVTAKNWERMRQGKTPKRNP